VAAASTTIVTLSLTPAVSGRAKFAAQIIQIL
jgi:hypothetical protein